MQVDAQCRVSGRTRSPGRKMEGRELDVLVAQMMGWVWVWEWEWSVGEPKKWYRQLVDPSWNWDMCGEPEPEDVVMEDRFVHAPNYSTDIAASFQVDRATWRWKFCEAADHLEVTLYVPVNGGLNVVGSPIAEPVRVIIIDVPWSESGSKAQTYALGRCRAACHNAAMEETE